MSRRGRNRRSTPMRTSTAEPVPRGDDVAERERGELVGGQDPVLAHQADQVPVPLGQVGGGGQHDGVLHYRAAWRPCPPRAQKIVDAISHQPRFGAAGTFRRWPAASPPPGAAGAAGRSRLPGYLPPNRPAHLPGQVRPGTSRIQLLTGRAPAAVAAGLSSLHQATPFLAPARWPEPVRIPTPGHTRPKEHHGRHSREPAGPGPGWLAYNTTPAPRF